MDNQQLITQIEQALKQQQVGQIDEAIALFEQILSHVPNQADALHGLGLCYAQKKMFAQAVHYLKEAVTVAPQIPAFHNNLGNAYKLTGNLELAKSHYLEALRLKSPYSDAHNNLGSIYYLQGQYNEAKNQYQKALRINPKLWDAHFNIANCYINQSFYLEAKPHLEEVLKLRPDHLGAINNLGIIYCILKQFEAAKPLLKKTLEREPNNVEALFHLGIANASTNELEEAKQNYIDVIKMNGSHDRAHHNLATLYLHLKDKEKAYEHYEKAYQLNSHNQTALHMTKALRGETLKEGAPPEYTRALFDQYAYTYNQHVKEKLDYQVPHLLRALIKPFSDKKTTPWDVLDLGCGTGLCAPYFIDIADKLYGVDISPNMIDEAIKLDAYYKLAVDEITHYLKKTTLTFDLIICADVFVYFGCLNEIFEQCYMHLNPNGYFLFSIERLFNDAPEGYQLNPTGRYQHHPEYINQIAAAHQFKLLAHEQAIIRQQEEGEVSGDIFLLQKLVH